MKKSILIILLLFIISVILFSLFCESDISPLGGGSNPLQTIQTSNPVWTNCMKFDSVSPDWGINRIQMITSPADFGLAVGYDRKYGNDYLLGMILCYSNSSWKAINLPSSPIDAPYSITSLSVINPNVYFIVGNELSSSGHKIGFVSQINGSSWNNSEFETMISNKYEFNDIAMFNATTGYVIGNDLSNTVYRGFILSYNGLWNTLESTSLGISYTSYRFNSITLDSSGIPIIIGKETNSFSNFILIKTSSSSVVNTVVPSGSSVNYDILRLTCTGDVIKIIGYKYDLGTPFLLEGTFNSSSGSVNVSETDLSGIINPYSTYFHDISKNEIACENTIANKGFRIKKNGSWGLSSDFSYPSSASNSCGITQIGDSWFYSAVNVTDTGDSYSVIKDNSNKISSLVKNDVLEYPFPSTSFRWKLNGVDVVSNGDKVVAIGKDLDTNQGLLLSSSGSNWSWLTAQIPDAVTWEPIDLNMRSVFGGLGSAVKCSFCGSFVNSGGMLKGFLCTGSSFLTMANDASLAVVGTSSTNWYLNSVDYASTTNVLVVGRKDDLKTGFIAGFSGSTWTDILIPSEVLSYNNWTLKKYE